MTPLELPYDVLLRIFSNVVTHRDDRLKGETSSWLLSSTSADLLSCSLVARSWRLAAQHTLWRGIRVTTHDQGQKLLRTVETRPELPAQTRAVSLGVTQEQTAEVASMLLVDVLETCINARTLDLGRLHNSSRIRVYDAVSALGQLETLSWNWGWSGGQDHDWQELLTLSETFGLLKRRPTLRRLELNLTSAFTYNPIHVPASAGNITSLALMSQDPRIDLSIVQVVGPTLRQLSMYCEYSLPSSLAARSFTRITTSLRQLRLVINLSYGDEVLSTEWFELLLPQFNALEKLSVTSDLLPPTTLRRLPSLLHWLEVIDWSDSIHSTLRIPFASSSFATTTSASRPLAGRELSSSCRLSRMPSAFRC